MPIFLLRVLTFQIGGLMLNAAPVSGEMAMVPIRFEPSRGSLPLLARGNGYSIGLRADGADLRFGADGAGLRVNFLGGQRRPSTWPNSASRV